MFNLRFNKHSDYVYFCIYPSIVFYLQNSEHYAILVTGYVTKLVILVPILRDCASDVFLSGALTSLQCLSPGGTFLAPHRYYPVVSRYS